MADTIVIKKISIGKNQYSLDAEKLDGKSSEYFQKKNIIQSIDKNSTDSQYPSASCVYGIIGDIEDILKSI